jgi:hypothetical protein
MRQASLHLADSTTVVSLNNRIKELETALAARGTTREFLRCSRCYQAASSMALRCSVTSCSQHYNLITIAPSSLSPWLAVSFAGLVEAIVTAEPEAVPQSRSGAMLLKLPAGMRLPQLKDAPLFIRHFYRQCFEGPLGRLTPGKRYVIIGNGGSEFIADVTTVVFCKNSDHSAYIALSSSLPLQSASQLSGASY